MHVPDDAPAKHEQLQTMLEDGSLLPDDLVDRWDGWRPAPDDQHRESVEQMVDTTRIVGTDPMNTDRLVERRFVKIVNRLADGRWQPRTEAVHLVEHPNGELYVCSDGNHRTLAFKYFGITPIYAEVDRYE